MSYRVDEIENALLDTLAQAPALYYLRAVIILPSLDRPSLEQEAWRGPAAGVIAVSGRYSDDMASVSDEAGLFAVVALNRNLRTPAAALASAAAGETGCWDIIADARAVLHDNQLGLDIFNCRPLRRYLLFAGDKGAACVLELEITWRHTA